MSWTENAKSEITRAGLLDKDSDYEGMIGTALIELVDMFGKQGHSGMSARLVAQLFTDLVNGRPLSPLTDNPDEWMMIEFDGTKQNKRCSDVFMKPDGTVYSLDGGEFKLPGFPPRRLG